MQRQKLHFALYDCGKIIISWIRNLLNDRKFLSFFFFSLIQWIHFVINLKIYPDSIRFILNLEFIEYNYWIAL